MAGDAAMAGGRAWGMLGRRDARWLVSKRGGSVAATQAAPSGGWFEPQLTVFLFVCATRLKPAASERRWSTRTSRSSVGID